MEVLIANPSYKQAINNKYERYFIRSGSRWPHSGVKIKGTVPHYLPFPFSLAYSAVLLREANLKVYVIDAVALDISEENLLNRINAIKPRFIFYEIATPTADHDLLLAKKIKEISDSTIIVGGAHASAFAFQILLGNKSIDFVLRGEYEWSLRELIKSITEGSDNFPLGSVFRNGGKIIDNGYPNLADSLDKLPSPLRDIFPSNDSPNPTIYWDGFCQYRPAVQMQSSRGCIYSCYFCLQNRAIYNNGRYRTFSAKRVVDEMQELVHKYRAKEIYFDDDDFTTDKKHVFSICEEISERKLNIKWSCMGNVINLTEEILRIMANNGCIGIKFGVESASEKILRTIGKPVDLEKTREIVEFCRKHRIKTHATFSIGLWEETEDDIEKTLRFIKTLAVDSIQMSIATPYPGTKLFDLAKGKGLLENVDWAKYDGKTFEAVHFSDLKRNRIKKVRKKIIIIWYLRRLLSPLWWMRHLHIILRTLSGLGVTFLFNQVVSIIIDERKN